MDYYEFNDFIFVHGWIPIKQEFVDKDGTYKDLEKVYWPVENIYNPDWRNSACDEDWNDSRWLCGFKQWQKGIKELGKTIVCGHWHTSWAHSIIHKDGYEFPIEYCKPWYYTDEEAENWTCNFGIFYDDGIIGIDGCTAISGQVNVLVVEE